MSEAKHTPGPWRIDGFGVFGKHKRIATIVAFMPPRPDDEADAALIAAAPDLLAACERALEQLLEVNPHPVRTIEALRAAIAKAKGGA